MNYNARSAIEPSAHYAKAFSILLNSIELKGAGANTSELITSIRAELGPEFCERNAASIDKVISGLVELSIARDKRTKAERKLRSKLR